MIQEKKYFVGLDSLRAIGALSVLVGHIELVKSDFDLPNLLHLSYFRNTSGHTGVILFFVLSGFLITYLLLNEKTDRGRISIKNFYIRRALRIWPIYYLTFLFLIFCLPQIVSFPYYGKFDFSNSNSFSSILIYLFLVPNFMVFGIPGIGGGYHLGTIGIEEQFYLIWPWIVRYTRKILSTLIFLFVGISLTPHLIDFIQANYLIKGSSIYNFASQLSEFFAYFKVNAMALGGIFAWLFLNPKYKLTSLFQLKIVQIGCFLFGFGGWFFGLHFPYFTDEMYMFCFAVIVFNLASNSSPIFSFKLPLLTWIGKISYGMYVFHWIVLYLVFELVLPTYSYSSSLFNFLFYSLGIGLTILVSWVSYTYLEAYFLRLKNRF